MTTSKKSAATAGAAVTLLLLTGCMRTGTAGAADPSAVAPANSSGSASATPSKSSGGTDTDATFGQTITYDDGLAVTVVDKGNFMPSTYASKEKAKHYREFQITLKNGTDKKFDPTLVYPTLQDGDADASAVIDIQKKIGVAPQTKLRPGKTVKWLVAFGIDSNDLTMDVALNDFQHDDASFVSK